MTEKRFENRLDKSNVKFNTLNPVWDNEKETGLNVFEMIDELNKLSDENEVLKERNQELYDKLQVTMSKHSLQMGETELIKHMIQEAYETERTQIGKNVLKQLLDCIGVME